MTARRGAALLDALLEASVVGSFSRLGPAVRAPLWGFAPLSTLPARGRSVLVTGTSAGLGYATAAWLLRAGATVLGTARTRARAEGSVAALTHVLGADVVAARYRVDTLDLADLRSVRAFAARRCAEGGALHAIVHNAGAMEPVYRRTPDGFERTYQVHVLAPFVLTDALLVPLAEADRARVVTVTSGGLYTVALATARLGSAHRWRPALAYARAKRAQAEFAPLASARTARLGVDWHTVHPGWAATPGLRTAMPRFARSTGPLLRTAEQAGEGIAWVTLAAVPQAQPGALWLDRRRRGTTRLPGTSADPGERAALWRRVCADAGVDPARWPQR